MADTVVTVIVRAHDEFSRTFNNFSLDAASLAKVAGVVAAAGAAMAAALVKAADEGGRYADSIGDIGQRTGQTAEAISRLAFVASQSDTSINELASTYRFLASGLKEARDEMSEQRATFEALGFSAAQLDQGLVGPREAMLRLADAVRATDNPMEKLALTTAVLGRGAAGLVPFLDRGAAGISALEAESDRLNLTIRAVAAEVGDRYTKALEKAELASLALKSEIGVGVLPVLTRLIDRMTEITAQGTGVVLSLQNIITAAKGFSGIGSDTRAMGEFFALLQVWAKQTLPPLQAIVDVLGAIKALGEITNPIGKSFRDVETGKSAATGDEVGFFARKEAIEAEQKAREKGAAAASAAAKKHGEEVASLAAQYKNLLDLIEQTTIFAKPVTELRGVKPITATEMEPGEEIFDSDLEKRLAAAAAEAGALDEELKRLGVDTEAFTDRLIESGSALDSIAGSAQLFAEVVGASLETAFDPYLNAMRNAQQAAFDFTSGVGAGFNQFFTDLFVNGGKAFRSLESLARNLITTIGKLIVDIGLAIIKALALRAISGFLGFSGGGETRGVQTIASAATGGYLRAFAEGGVDGTPGGRFRGPGTGTSDSILARVSDGEFIVRSAVVERPGVLSFLRALNAGTGLAASFAGGGHTSGFDFGEATRALRESSSPAPARAPINITIVARDADSVRRDLSQGGRSYREIQRLQDEGRL